MKDFLALISQYSHVFTKIRVVIYYDGSAAVVRESDQKSIMSFGSVEICERWMRIKLGARNMSDSEKFLQLLSMFKKLKRAGQLRLQMYRDESGGIIDSGVGAEFKLCSWNGLDEALEAVAQLS